MKRVFSFWLIAATTLVAGLRAEETVLLQEADVLPLALGDDFEFRKVKTYLHASWDGRKWLGGQVDQMVSFEQKRRDFGAITRVDYEQRFGKYITLFWRANRTANITVRLEYRQQKLGPFVQAQEVTVENASGNHVTEFAVTGDDHRWDGAITSWRALLIEDGKIVGLHSSFLWN